MVQTILKVDGMMCGMCEAHMNEAIRKAFDVKTVTSSHTKGETLIISENSLDKEVLKKTVEETGYRLLSYEEVPYEPKSVFHLFGKKA